jgi:hypothetical protein
MRRRVWITALFALAIAGCASTSANDPADRSVEVHGLFMGGGSVARR